MSTGRRNCCGNSDLTPMRDISAVLVCDANNPAIKYRQIAVIDNETNTISFRYFDIDGIEVIAPSVIDCENIVTGDVNATVAINPILFDAFLRQRVSQPFALFDSKQILDNQPLYFDDAQVSGGGTSSTWSKARASTTIAVSNLTAGRRVRQTKRRFNYQSGKSQLGVFTGKLYAPATGLTRRMGYYDDNNGIFFESSPTALNMVIRSSVTGVVVENRVPQASWNVDPMNGLGASGITLQPNNELIFFFDFEWLGVGSVAVGFVINRMVYYVHFFHHSNLLDKVYMSTPNLPVRYEIINDGTGAAGELEHVCSTIISEGGQDLNGIVRSVDRGTSAFQTLNNTARYPILSLRLKTTHLDQTVVQLSANVLCTSTNNYRWALTLNPTIVGVDNASWTDLANSAIQYDVSRTNQVTVTGGTILASGYGSNQIDAVVSQLQTALMLGATIAGVRDEMVLEVQNMTSGLENFYGALTFRELT